jgi:molecular chaperone GrpE
LERASFVSSDYENEEAKKINEGIRMILTQIQEVLAGLGVTEIEARSAKFDPNTMDAVMHVEDEKAGESEVIEVFTKGYIKGDKVIRHAMVKVAN